MKNFTDDDIQFLGGENLKNASLTTPPSDNGKKHSRWQRVSFAVIIVLLFVICGLIGWNYYEQHRWAVSFEYPLSRSGEQIIQDLNRSLSPAGKAVHEAGNQKPQPSQAFTVDSIDGVSMRFYNLAGLQASVSRSMPADSDSTVVLVTQAWDYYYDNARHYHYLGDFTLNGKSLARGTGKAGFVAITKSGWQMGIGQDDSVRDYVANHGGSMFRQFALVSAGQICLKQFALKGKVHRRALARKPGAATAYYVETIHKESLYDFSEALADYGFIDAIYLTGADGTEPCYRDADGKLRGDMKSWKRKSNLLVFRRK